MATFHPTVPNPRTIEPVKHPKILWETHIQSVSPFGRANANNIPISRMSPHCFNLRSATRSIGSMYAAIHHLRLTGKMCTPSVNIDGSLVAGESPFCTSFGSVDSDNKTLTNNLCNMSCTRCGLSKNLSAHPIAAIGQ